MSTFDIEYLCFIDSETRAFSWVDPDAPEADVRRCGAYRYARHAYPVIWTFGIGLDPVELVAAKKMDDKGIRWKHLPAKLRAFVNNARAKPDKYKFVAWNSAFDAAIWAATDYPELPVECWIDAMVQAAASNLPPDLNSASRAITGRGKQEDGKDLIALFSPPNGWTPQGKPEEWERFCSYAVRDTEELREVFLSTRQLPLIEWEEFWASEEINRRGLSIDLDFAAKCAALAEIDRARLNERINELTDGAVSAVTQIARICTWAYDRLEDMESRAIMTTKYKDLDEEEDGEPEPEKMSLARDKIAKILVYLDDKRKRSRHKKLSADEDAVYEVLSLREFGGSSVPQKFQKALDIADGMWVRGQYVMNGAAQTGRYSSRGLQVHNLTRKVVGDPSDDMSSQTLANEVTAIETIERYQSGVTDIHEIYEQLFAEHGPVSRTLSRVIRPTIVAPKGQRFVWGDWSAIEARMLPWLAGSRGAEKVLDIFRGNDADPSAPDIYMHEAARIFDIPLAEVPKKGEMRQTGKVAVLALGYGGAVGALDNMATAYGIYIGDNLKRHIVDTWRGNNIWARTFWDLLWESALSALQDPDTIYPAGRVAYLYDKSYLGGTLFCALPCGRLLSYPRIKWRKWTEVNKFTGEEEEKNRLTYLRGYGYSALWYGKFCLSGDSLVATSRGWVALQDVQSSDQVWDGVEWVEHDGVACQGIKHTAPINGVRMTPDHMVLCRDGWKQAQDIDGPEWQDVRLPDSFTTGANAAARETGKVVRAMHLRRVCLGVKRWLDAQKQAAFTAIVRLSDTLDTIRNVVSCYSQNVEAPCLCGVAVDAGQMPVTDASGVAQLRCTRNTRVPSMAKVRKLLVRYGVLVSTGFNIRTPRQRQRVFVEKLLLGDVRAASAKQAQHATCKHATAVSEDRHTSFNAALPMASEPVYDLVNAGPRSRFVVLGADGPMIVHNCENITQATAASLLRYCIRALRGHKIVKLHGHTHDELLALTTEKNVERVRKAMHKAMVAGAPWSEGLPLAVECEDSWYYTKAAP